MEEMTLPQALEKVIDGAKITRTEWKDKRWYCFLKDNLLQIHKAGEDEDITHMWIINEGDLVAFDWVVV